MNASAKLCQIQRQRVQKQSGDMSSFEFFNLLTAPELFDVLEANLPKPGGLYMHTGPDLIDAIKNNAKLMKIDNCPGVPARLGLAAYGDWQDDKNETVLRYVDQESLAKAIEDLLDMSSAEPITNTSVWHFSVQPPVHHFVVIPWYRFNIDVGWVYTVLMAYEGKYTLGEYIQKAGNAPSEEGYKEVRTRKELRNMLGRVLISKSVWPKYFGGTIERAPNKITCWKYDSISLDLAIQNVNKFNMD